MRTLIVGSGPTGLLLGAALARRGHQVTSVDRDPGPSGRRLDPSWRHAVRARARLPAPGADGSPSGVARGVRLLAVASAPGRSRCRDPVGSRQVLGMLSRRSTFERALRRAAEKQPGLTLRTGHVDGLVLDGGESSALGSTAPSSRLTSSWTPQAERAAGRVAGRSAAIPSSTATAASRTSTAPTGCARGPSPGPMVNPIAYMADFDGYQCLVFLHESGHFSVVLVRPTADAALKALRFEAAFEAACRAIPALAEWTEPDRAQPTSDVLVGGALRNVYRRQAGTPGLVAVGDSVATTTPTRGRGIAMACMQVTALLALLDEGADPSTVAEPFGAWCDRNIEPWVADHIAIDGGMVRRWQGEDLDLSVPLTSDLIAAAVEADPRIGQHAAGLLRDDRDARDTPAGRAVGAGGLPERLATAVLIRPDARRARGHHPQACTSRVTQRP